MRAGAPPIDERELEKEIAELQKQRALEEGRLASFGTASSDFDADIYGGSSASSGGYVSSISVGGGDDDDDDYSSMSASASSIRKLTGRYTAPKSAFKDIPQGEDEPDPFEQYRRSRVSDRDDDYKKRRLNRQLNLGPSSYRDRMIETALEREHDRVLREVEKKKKQEKEEAEKKHKERQEQLKEMEKQRKKDEKRKRKEEKKKLKEERKRKKRKTGEDGESEEEEKEERERSEDEDERKKRRDEEDEEDRQAERRQATMAAHFKHKEPKDAKKPDRPWVLHVFKSGQILGAPLNVGKRSCYRFGREAELADIVAAHESCSKQHAALQFREVNGSIRPYLIDVGSANGTFLNKQKIKPNEYVELKEGDAIVLGCSTRQYVLQVERYRG